LNQKANYRNKLMKSLHFLGVLPIAFGAFIASPAFAQNAAGAASFNLNATGSVVGASIAAAVGEQSALAVGVSTSGGSSAYAIGASSLLETPEWAAPTGSEYTTTTTGEGVGIVQIAITGGNVTVDMAPTSTGVDQAALDPILQKQEQILATQQQLVDGQNNISSQVNYNTMLLQDLRYGYPYYY
jgi:hypothetical protein